MAGDRSLRNGLPATADLTVAIGPGAFLPQGQVKGSAKLVDAPGGEHISPRAMQTLIALERLTQI